MAFGKDAITISKLSGVDGRGGGVLRMGDGVSPHVSEAAAGMEWGDCVVLGNNRQNEGPEIRHLVHHMKHDEGIILLVEGFG